MGQHSHLYATARWKKRRARLLRDEPLCRMCKAVGRLTPATIADHITPHRGDPEAFEGPIQPLCPTCHSAAKQAQEHSGMLRGGDIDGIPVDPNHHWHKPAAKTGGGAAKIEK
jgi:5-methylcytosine-specific restriction enzyme A